MFRKQSTNDYGNLLQAAPKSKGSTVVVFLLCLSLVWGTPALAKKPPPPPPTVPFVFVPGYAASSPKKGEDLSYTFHRGVSPQSLNLSVSYRPFVRSLTKAGYAPGKTFFGAVYDWRMPVAPDDGVFDGNLNLVTAASMTSGTFPYAINYLGYWLDQVVQANPDVEYVDVASHSTGNVLVRAYIQSPAYGAAYIDSTGALRHLPKIRYYIAGAGINQGTIHSWRPWNEDFQDVLTGFIPTTKIETRFAALAFAAVSAGDKVTGPDYDIILPMILKPDKTGRLAPDPLTFFRLYNPMRQRVMPTNDFLTLPGGSVPTNVNTDPSLRSTVMLDLNTGSAPGNNPWAAKVGMPNDEGGVIATFATGARQKKTLADFKIPGRVNKNPFVCTAVAIQQLPASTPPMCEDSGNDPNCYLPLVALFEPRPSTIPVSDALFLPRVGDVEVVQQLGGDGNGFTSSYEWTYKNDPNVTLVTWGNGPAPASVPMPPEGCTAAASVPEWTHETGYPVYHDVFYYNPDVRKFIIRTLTGATPGREKAITAAELRDLRRLLRGEE